MSFRFGSRLHLSLAHLTPAHLTRVAAGLLTLALGQFAITERVQAHRLNLTTSDIEWRADSGALDITHRLHLEDALSLLARLGAADGVLDLEASARLLIYFEAHFSLSTKQGVLELEPYGAHLEGGTLFVYQRAHAPELPTALEVQNRLLHDIEPAVHNQVNWRVDRVVRSHDGHRDAAVAWLVL